VCIDRCILATESYSVRASRETALDSRCLREAFAAAQRSTGSVAGSAQDTYLDNEDQVCILMYKSDMAPNRDRQTWTRWSGGGWLTIARAGVGTRFDACHEAEALGDRWFAHKILHPDESI